MRKASMPQYFLHICESDQRINDPEGRDFVNLAEAQAEAILGTREILAEQMLAGEPLGRHQIEICDASGALLATVKARDTFKID